MSNNFGVGADEGLAAVCGHQSEGEGTWAAMPAFPLGDQSNRIETSASRQQLRYVFGRDKRGRSRDGLVLGRDGLVLGRDGLVLGRDKSGRSRGVCTAKMVGMEFSKCRVRLMIGKRVGGRKEYQNAE